MRILFSVLALGVALSFSAGAAADDKEAKTAFKEGKQHFAAGEFSEAAVSFRKAYELKPNWKLLYNIGQCEVAAKRYGLALQAFERYMVEGGDDLSQVRQAEVLTEVKRLREMVGSVDLVAPEGCQVLVDNHDRGQTPLMAAMLVSAGVEHRLTVKRGEETLLERSFLVRGGKSIELEVAAPAKTAEATPVDNVPAQESEEGALEQKNATPKSMMKTIGWVTLGVGAAVLVGGAVTGGMAVSEDGKLEDDCSGGSCPEGYDLEPEKKRDKYALITDILIPTGIVVAAAGATLLIIDAVKSKESNKEPVARIHPAVTPNGAAFVLEGSF